MIFAELQYGRHYSEMHFELVDHLQNTFPDIQHGLQGDSWIWIFSGDEKVAVDTFSSMKHQIKCDKLDSSLVARVIESLSDNYKLTRYDVPVLEPHDEC